MWGGAAHGERTHENAQCHAAPASEPSGHGLEAGGVDDRQRHAGRQAQRERRRVRPRIDEEQSAVDGGAPKSRHHEEGSGGSGVCQAAGGRGEGSQHESELHGEGQAGRLPFGEPPDVLQLWSHRRRGEPERQNEQLRTRNGGQGASLALRNSVSVHDWANHSHHRIFPGASRSVLLGNVAIRRWSCVR